MKDLLEHIKETWETTQVGPENEILQNYGEQSKTLIIKYASILYIMGGFYTTMPVIVSRLYSLLPTNETYTARYLFRVEHVLDVEKYFNLLMLHAFVGIFFLISVWIAADGMFILCTQHVCALFEGIRYNMERLQGSDFMTVEPNIADDEAYHIIIGCIKSYKRVLKLVLVTSLNVEIHVA
ncbi:odorant receptor 13a-like protein [Lasius niger]|uniref:Odorant receptor 13a-like protein n=1 Tax=Lasius niger TaxID=67767 RepID=A0A0J7KHC4_LASNI|nr:odorant receptor 13a-like protein [Lasius niger]